MLMPGAYRGDHDAGIGEKATHAGLGGGGSIEGQLSACLFDGLVRESLDRLRRRRDKEPATFLQLDGKRCRLDFNESLPPANFQLGAWLEPCFSP